MCTTAPGEDIACGSGDLANEAAEPAAIWAAGGVSNEEGKLHMTAGIYRTADPLPDLDAEIDFKGLQRGWTSPDAEIHLVVRDHGPVVTENDGYLEQISNFNDDFDGCCANQQAAPYAPGEDGQKTLYMMSDRAEIGGSRAILNRRGDLIQAIIETINPASTPEEAMDPADPIEDPEVLDDTSAGFGAFNGEKIGVIFILSICMGLF